MKRILAVLLAGLMLLSLAACGGKEENVIKVGSLELEGMNDIRTDAHNAHRREERNVADGAVFENIIYFAMDGLGWSRKKSVLVNFVAILVLSMPAILGLNVLSWLPIPILLMWELWAIASMVKPVCAPKRESAAIRTGY